MFSKLNQEFASHQKGFQIILGLFIIVPFVFMIPGVDPFGTRVAKPSVVGTIGSEKISWDTYEKEARNLLAFIALNGNVNVLSNANSIIQDERFVEDVLKYMADKKIVENQIKNGFDPGKIEAKDYKEFSSEIEKMVSKQIPGFTVAGQIENIRVRLRIGGEDIDKIIADSIIRKRFEAHIKKKVEVSDEALIAEVKKQEKTYKIREGNYNSSDFRDEPLKEYYEKNKEKFFRKDAVKASVIVIDHKKFKEEYAKLNVKPELDKFISDALAKVDNKDPKVVEAAKKEAIANFESKKLKELATAKATMIKESFIRTIKGSKDSAKYSEAFATVAKAVNYDVQQSVYVDPSDVKEGKFFMNDKKLSETILGLSVENPIVIYDGFVSSYVVVLNDKGTHAEFSSVRNELLKAVYDADANNYYVTNKEEFKEPHRMRIGLAEFTASMFAAETKVGDEAVKAAYEKEASYKQPQRKLIQFAVEVDAKATDEDKKKLEEKLKAFADSNKGKEANDIENLIVKAEDGIKKTTLGWKVQNSLEIGTKKEFMSAAFSTETGQFTEILKTDKTMAVLYVAGQRDKTPFEEVKGEIKSKLEAELSQDIAKDKAQDFHTMLKGVNPKTIENINKAIEAYGKTHPLEIRYLDDIMPMSADLDPRFFQFMAQRHNIPGDFFFNISNLTTKRLFTNVRALPPAYQRAVGFIKEDIPENYMSFDKEEVKQRIYRNLNANKARELAAAHAVKVKQELEKNADNKEKLNELLVTYKFKEAKGVKFKNASATVKTILKDSPAAGFIGSDSQQEGAVNTVVYVESTQEVSDEDLKKFKDEHMKRMKEEKEAEKLKNFWEEERKKFTVDVPQEKTAES